MNGLLATSRAKSSLGEPPRPNWLGSLTGLGSKGAVPANRGARRHPRQFSLEPLESRLLLSVNIVFDTSLDTSGFFSGEEGANRLAVLNAAANDLESRLNDDLNAITAPPPLASWTTEFSHPSTGADHTITNLLVPANTIIVYVGARDLAGSTDGEASMPANTFDVHSASGEAWADNVRARGQAGALLAAPTDVGPWGGSIAFDSLTVWYAGLGGNVPSGKDDLYTVAQHELGHLLGYNDGSPGRPTSLGHEHSGWRIQRARRRCPHERARARGSNGGDIGKAAPHTTAGRRR